MHKYSMQRVMETDNKATLHEARHMKKAEKVIIKELKKKYHTIEDCNSDREVQVMGKMKHDNIHKMIEMFHDDRELLMVFEHFPEDLRTVLKKRDKPFTEPETKVIMVQILSGVDFIHKIRYIHCGLKPAVIVCNEDATVVKITDFSTAKCLDNAPFGDMNVKPPWYTAPEVLLGSERYAEPIDIWSAGCIMAELLVGKPILKGDTNQTQMLAICDFLGTFSKSQWPEGYCLVLDTNYKLPKFIEGKGFSNLNCEASSDAKEMILDMLKWFPKNRKTAEQCLNSSYLRSSGNIGGKDSVAAWKERWRYNIPATPLHELDRIISANRKSQEMGQNDSFGFTNDPLADNRYARDGQTAERAMSGLNNGIEQRDGLRIIDPPLSSLEEEAMVREERRRDKPNIANNDLMFDEAFGMKEKNGKNVNYDQGNAQLDMDNQLTARSQGLTRAERVKLTNENKYKSIYQNHLSYALGGAGEETNMKKDIYGNDIQGDAGGQSLNTGRIGQGRPNFTNTQSTNFGQKQDSLGDNTLRFRDPLFETDQQTMPTPRTDRAQNEKHFRDHETEAKKLYDKDPLRYKDRYGNPLMRNLIGGKPPGSMKFPDDDEMDNKKPRSRKNQSGYTPTWTDRGKV